VEGLVAAWRGPSGVTSRCVRCVLRVFETCRFVRCALHPRLSVRENGLYVPSWLPESPGVGQRTSCLFLEKVFSVTNNVINDRSGHGSMASNDRRKLASIDRGANDYFQHSLRYRQLLDFSQFAACVLPCKARLIMGKRVGSFILCAGCLVSGSVVGKGKKRKRKERKESRLLALVDSSLEAEKSRD